MNQNAYSYEEVEEVLNSTMNGNTEPMLEELAKKMQRTKSGLRMIVFFNNKFRSSPNSVKAHSKNLYNLLTEYHANMKKARVEQRVMQQEGSAAQIGQKMTETFAQLQTLMSNYIEARVDERTAEIKTQADADVKQNIQELSELRAFKQRIQEMSK